MLEIKAKIIIPLLSFGSIKLPVNLIEELNLWMV